MAKIAYIFFGQVKNFDEKQYSAFQENVASKLDDFDVDYFLVTSKSSFYSNPRHAESEPGVSKIDHTSIQKYFNFEEVYYDQDERADEDIDGLCESVIKFGEAWKEGDALQSLKNSIKQIYSLEYFYDKFAHKINEYDYFVLSRSDLYHTHPLNVDCFSRDEDLFAPYYDICPQIDYGWFGGINDRFAVIKNKSALKTYCTRYSSIKSNPEYYHAEQYLLKQLKTNNVNYGKIHNFMFLLNRASGKLSDFVGIQPDEKMNTNLKGISKSYFINLDRRTDRLHHMLINTPFFTERFSAIDAKQMQLNEEVKKLFPKTWQKRTKAEICCAISHYRLWQKLIDDRGAKNYLILEDDTVFKPGFVNFWNDVYSEHLPEDAFLVYLGGCQPWNKPQYHKVLQRHNDYFCTVKKNDYFTKDNHFWHMNANSYVLSKHGASLLCQWVEQFGMDEALDNFMQNFFNENKLFAAPELVFHMNPLMSYQLHEENDNTEIDKKSDLRFAEEKFQSVDLKNILYWKHETGSGNFGDELNVPVGKFLFGNSVDFNKEGSAESIRLIGSNLGDIKRGDIVSGVGFHHHTQKIESMGVEFNCVRGPLSLKTLNQQLDEPKNCFLGDPALLLKLFHEPNLREELVDKIGVIPHISNIDYFKKQIGQLGDFYLIDPTNSWEQVVSEIYSCRSIISSSLHGLICSDAYDKPNVWIKVPGQSIPPCDENSDYGDFKYWDYLLSQGREVKFINNIKDELSGKLYSGGNKIDLAKMFFAISGKKLIENNCFPNLKPISSNQIPKKIHLSWKNKNVLDSSYELIRKGAKNLELLNPDWDVQVYDDEDVNRLLRDSIGRDNWNLIKDRKITEKTDLWRLLKTYKEGGLYVDIDRYIDTPISEIVNHKTSCVLPTFQDVDFSQDFILTCAKNPIVGRAIANNLNYRKQGKPLFFLAVYSYMQSVCEILGAKIVGRGNNPEYFNDIRKQIEACEYLETFREIGPEYHTLYRNIDKKFNAQTFEKDKADFYNAENVVHWNAQTQAFHVSQKTKKQKLIFTHKNLFEQDFICELFDDFDVVINEDMNIVEENSVIVYSDMYAKNINAYPEKFRENLNQLREKQKEYFEKLKNKNCILVHLSDEHCHAEIDHYKNFKHVFRQYYRKDAASDNVTFIPLGYKKGFKT